MNNGVKAEKENTPNEANLQEEEVRGLGAAGTARDAGRARALSRVRGEAAGRGSRGAAAQGVGNCPGLWPPGRACFRVLVGCVPEVA